MKHLSQIDQMYIDALECGKVFLLGMMSMSLQKQHQRARMFHLCEYFEYLCPSLIALQFFKAICPFRPTLYPR